jgi:hypothetical protein
MLQRAGMKAWAAMIRGSKSVTVRDSSIRFRGATDHLMQKATPGIS